MIKIYKGTIQASCIYNVTLQAAPTRWQRFLAWLGIKKRPVTVMDVLNNMTAL